MDKISGGTISVFYRIPTTEEVIGYNSELYARTGNTVNQNQCATRIKYGEKIIVGFKTGDFVDGKNKPMSSTPGEEGYAENWKDTVKRYAADIIEALAINVFELSVARAAAPKEDKNENPT